MLTSPHRILETKDFKQVFQKGRSVFDPLFLLRYTRRDEQISRFGFVISTKVSKKAVQRNKIKRRLREITRKEPLFLENGYDYVFIVKKPSVNAPFKQFKKAVLEALVKAK